MFDLDPGRKFTTQPRRGRATPRSATTAAGGDALALVVLVVGFGVVALLRR